MTAPVPTLEALPPMRIALATALALALAAGAPAAAGADPRFALLASDGTGYAIEAAEPAGQPVTFTLSDDSGGAPVESRLPSDTEGRTLRVAATARCLPGGSRLLRVYGTTERRVRRVVAELDSGDRVRLKLVRAPSGWELDGRVMGRVLEVTDRSLRLIAIGSKKRRLASVRISFTQTCSTEGAKALAATLVPAQASADTTSMTARLVLPARSTEQSYSVSFRQPPWAAGENAFARNPYGSPLGPDGDVTLEGPGTLESTEPTVGLPLNVCLRGFSRQLNTVIVRVPAGESTTLAWPLEVAPEPLWASTRLEAAFQVRRKGFGGIARSNTASYDGPRGVEFDMRLRRRGSTAVVAGTTSSPLVSRRVTVYALQSRPRPAGAELIPNDFRPYRTLRTTTDSRGRFQVRFPITDRAYRVVAETRDAPADRVDDRSCPVERDFR